MLLFGLIAPLLAVEEKCPRHPRGSPLWYVRQTAYYRACLLILTVSQFTLFAKVKKGNKPDFHGAANAVKAKELYDYFYTKVGELYSPERVKNGVFQAMMEVGLVNDGPVRGPHVRSTLTEHPSDEVRS